MVGKRQTWRILFKETDRQTDYFGRRGVLDIVILKWRAVKFVIGFSWLGAGSNKWIIPCALLWHRPKSDSSANLKWCPSDMHPVRSPVPTRGHNSSTSTVFTYWRCVQRCAMIAVQFVVGLQYSFTFCVFDYINKMLFLIQESFLCKTAATTRCDIHNKSNHIPDDERTVLQVPNANHGA
jgi:hypothetical protein